VPSLADLVSRLWSFIARQRTVPWPRHARLRRQIEGGGRGEDPGLHPGQRWRGQAEKL